MNAALFSQLLWVDAGSVYTLPAERIAGIYAPANGEFSSPVFTMPDGATAVNSGLYLNAAAKWQGRLITGACDEGCNACALMPCMHSHSSRLLSFCFGVGRFAERVGMALWPDGNRYFCRAS